MKPTKRIVKELFHVLGLEISRYRPDTNPVETNPLGSDPLNDIRKLIRSNPLIIFDVGANIGQSVRNYKEVMPLCEIHSFEPSPTTCKLLAKNARSYRDVYLNDLAVGSSCGKKTFLENDHPDMSSFFAA